MSDLVKNGFQNLEDYQFCSQTVKVDEDIEKNVVRMALLEQEINSIKDSIKNYDSEAKKANIKRQADECRNAINSRNKSTLIFYTFIWTIVYLALAASNTGVLLYLLLPTVTDTNIETSVILLILYLIAIVVFNIYTDKIVKTPEREDWESDSEYNVTVWRFFMCVPIISSFAALGFFFAAKAFYEDISSSTRRYMRKEEKYLSQIRQIDRNLESLERSLDKLDIEYIHLSRSLQQICCCQYCLNGIKLLESNRLVYSCIADKNNNNKRAPNCVCNVKRNK